MERQHLVPSGVETLNQESVSRGTPLSTGQRNFLRNLGATVAIAAGLIAPRDADAVQLLSLNETNPRNNLLGVSNFWNGGSGSNIMVERFYATEPTRLINASVIANLQTSVGSYRDLTDPFWQTFRINLYTDNGGVPQNMFAPTFSIAIRSADIIGNTQTSITDNNGQFFRKLQFRLDQQISSGTWYMGMAFDATAHSGSGLPGLRINASNLVPLNDPNMGLFANSQNQIWRGLQYPNTSEYFDPNMGLEAVPEPASFVAIGTGLAALLYRRRKSK